VKCFEISTNQGQLNYYEFVMLSTNALTNSSNRVFQIVGYFKLVNICLRTRMRNDSALSLAKPAHFNRNNLALIATITVLRLISTAPMAGLSVKYGYNTPAASGMAIRL
jgi:hypothetical protein